MDAWRSRSSVAVQFLCSTFQKFIAAACAQTSKHTTADRHNMAVSLSLSSTHSPAARLQRLCSAGASAAPAVPHRERFAVRWMEADALFACCVLCAVSLLLGGFLSPIMILPVICICLCLCCCCCLSAVCAVRAGEPQAVPAGAHRQSSRRQAQMGNGVQGSADTQQHSGTRRRQASDGAGSAR